MRTPLRRRASLAAGLAILALAAPAAAAERTVFLRPWATATRHLEQGPLQAPMGAAFDPVAGELWVADTKNNLLGVFTPDGTPLFTTSSGGSLDEPARIARGPRGDLWILDNDRSRIARVDWRGRPLPPPRLQGLPAVPALGAIAFDDDGRLYLGENSEGRVHVFDADLRPRTRFGSHGYEAEQFAAITDIAVGGDRVVVLDAIGRPVQLFNRRGEFVRTWGEHTLGAENFSLPQGADFDSAGRLIVVDALRHEIKLFDDKGRYLGRFGGYGTGPGQVKTPVDVVVDASDRLFVVEKGNSRVQVFTIEEIERPAPAPRPGRR